MDVKEMQLEDEAEFEARVAAKIISDFIGYDFCNDECSRVHIEDGCSFCRMKYARLAVEEEMDG